jgi:DNA-binding protein HU-beta
MSKAELVKAVSEKSGLSEKDSETAVSAIIDFNIETLSKGKHITIMGFGTFDVKRHAVRHSINPTNKKPMVIPARTYPKFKVSRLLKEAVTGLRDNSVANVEMV